MKRTILASAMLIAALAAPAHAADMAIAKALAPTGFPGPNTGGLYLGIGTEAEVANSSVASSAFGTSLYSASASLKIVGGYQFKIPTLGWGAFEVDAAYTNLGNSVLCAPGVACSVGSTWSFQQGVLVSFPWTSVFSYLPALGSLFGTNPILPLPSGVTPISSLPYVGAFLKEEDISAAVAATAGRAWQIRPALGLGTINVLPAGVVLDTRLKYGFANSGFAIGPGATANKGSSLMAEAIFKY